MTVAANLEKEIATLAALYGVDGSFVDELRPWLENYAEIVVSETGFELITGGHGCARELAAAAMRLGASPVSVDGFLACDEAFPSRMLGLKVGVAGPTLYVRVMDRLAKWLDFLAASPEYGAVAAELSERLAPAATLYGLGFFTRAGSGMKTYTVTELARDRFAESFAGLTLSWPRPGFVSHRVLGEGGGAVVLDETKIYLGDVAPASVRGVTPRWVEILDVARELFGHGSGSVGLSLRPGDSPPEMKLYFERIGAVPNDFSAR